MSFFPSLRARVTSQGLNPAWLRARRPAPRKPIKKPAAQKLIKKPIASTSARELAISRAIAQAKSQAPAKALKIAHAQLQVAKRPGPMQFAARRQIAQIVQRAKQGSPEAETALGVLTVAAAANQQVESKAQPPEEVYEEATEAIEELPEVEEFEKDDFEAELEEPEEEMQYDLDELGPGQWLSPTSDDEIVGGFFGDVWRSTKKVLKSNVTKAVVGGVAIVFPPVGVPAATALVVADQVVRASEKGDKKAKKTIANTIALANKGNPGAQTAARVIGIAASSRALANGDPRKAAAITAASKAADAARKKASKPGGGWVKTSQGAIRRG